MFGGPALSRYKTFSCLIVAKYVTDGSTEKLGEGKRSAICKYIYVT